MHVRIMTAQIRPGKIDETIQLYRDLVGPTVGRQPGFKGTLLLIDRSTCKSILITLWETEADLWASERSGFYQQQIAQIAEFLASTPAREVYEVGTHALERGAS